MKKIHLHKGKSRLRNSFLMPVLIPAIAALMIIFSLSSFQNTPAGAQQDTLAPADTLTIMVDTLSVAADTLSGTSDTLSAVEEVEEFIMEEDVVAEESSFISGEYNTQQTRRGERLFNGLLPFQSGLHNCSSCHYLSPQEEINWNPSAWELARVWERNPEYDLMEVMNNPLSPRMIEDHAGMLINLEEAHLLEAYFIVKAEKGHGELHTMPIKAALFWGMGFLMLLALIDLFFTRKIPWKAVHILILLVGIGIHGQLAVTEAQALGRTQDYAPDQPIKFSHLIHSGENNIDCRYCHFTVDYSSTANIPSNNVCLNCHNVVRTGSRSGSFEINKIHRAVTTGEPVEWIRIHKLPDHTKFNHAIHTNAGKLDCTECHGEVNTMHIVRQVEDLSMGWCLTCHRENHVDFTNEYYHKYMELHDQIKIGEIEGVTPDKFGGQDCMNCHY